MYHSASASLRLETISHVRLHAWAFGATCGIRSEFVSLIRYQIENLVDFWIADCGKSRTGVSLSQTRSNWFQAWVWNYRFPSSI
jgi:hypothetical protein